MRKHYGTLALCLSLACLSAGGAACRRGGRDSRNNVANGQGTAHLLLVGAWTRASETQPIVHEQLYLEDGGFVLREFSREGTAIGDGTSGTRRHRRYSAELPLTLERRGRWRLAEGNTLELQLPLAEGDPLVTRCRIERISSSQLVLGTDGPDGPAQLIFQRGG